MKNAIYKNPQLDCCVLIYLSYLFSIDKLCLHSCRANLLKVYTHLRWKNQSISILYVTVFNEQLLCLDVRKITKKQKKKSGMKVNGKC